MSNEKKIAINSPNISEEFRFIKHEINNHLAIAIMISDQLSKEPEKEGEFERIRFHLNKVSEYLKNLRVDN